MGDNVRPRSHRLGYAFDHALEANANEILCTSCHEDQEFCSSCHAVSGVIPRSHSRVDWVRVVGGGGHAEEAQFNMESCVACHDVGSEDPVCVRCHER